MKTAQTLLTTTALHPPYKLLVAVLLGLGAAPAIGAGYSASTGAASGTIQVPGPSNFDVYPTSPAPGSASSSSAITIGAIGSTTAPYMDAASSSVGSASTGAAHAMASASAQAGIPLAAVLAGAGGSANAQSGASAISAFSDVFNLNATGYAPGTLVHLTFAINVDGANGGDGTTIGAGGPLSDASWSGNAWWRATTQVGSYGFEQGQSLFRNSTGTVNLTGDGHFGTSIYTADVLLGSNSVQLRAEASASAAAGVFAHSADPRSVSAESAFASNLGNTVSWGGILGLTTSDGTAITDFSAVSGSSGFNYANAYVGAVPVPAAAWLFGSGLLGLVGVLRRRTLVA